LALCLSCNSVHGSPATPAAQDELAGEQPADEQTASQESAAGQSATGQSAAGQASDSVAAAQFNSSTQSGAAWPYVRGNAHGTGAAMARVEDNLQLLWKYEAKDTIFEATPVVAGSVAYVGDADGTMHAVNLADGKKVWTKAFEDTGFLSGGAVAGKRLFVGDMNGMVRCLAASDGALQWEFETESEVFSGPTLHGDSVLVTTESGQLFSLRAADGKKQWEFVIEAPLRCAPTIVAGHTLLAGCDKQLHAVNLATGESTGAHTIAGESGNTVAIAGGRAYFGAESGVFCAVDVKAFDAMSTAWTYRDPRRGQGIRTAAAVSKSVIVYGSNGKAIYGLSPQTGERLWIKEVRSRVQSSPVIVKNPAGKERVIAATQRGLLLLLDAKTGETLWEYDAGGGFLGSPAVAEGRVLIANEDGTLYCFGVGQE